jgi:hypothetical protein
LCAFLGPWPIQCIPGSTLNNYDYLFIFQRLWRDLIKVYLNKQKITP